MEDLDTSTLFKEPTYNTQYGHNRTCNYITISCLTSHFIFHATMEALKPMLNSGDIKHCKINIGKRPIDKILGTNTLLYPLVCVIIFNDLYSEEKLYNILHVHIKCEDDVKRRRFAFNVNKYGYGTGRVSELKEQELLESCMDTVFNLGDYVVPSKTKSAAKAS